jgi:pimeloyl-ACP methyl ester carboxylesterase
VDTDVDSYGRCSALGDGTVQDVLSVGLASSPLAGGAPATIAYRSIGDGPPLVFLHGGWGYEIYPFDTQAVALANRFRVLIPDRSGHGRSTDVESLPIDFHRRAMLETVGFLEALGLERAVWWGHSDGAVIAGIAGIESPQHVDAVVLEALHLYRKKPASRAFFTQMATDPDSFSPRVIETLQRDHGADRWRRVLQLDGQAWLTLADTATEDDLDLYGGRLASLAAPALLIHGDRDLRTETGELDAIVAALPGATLRRYGEAGHSPHSQSATAERVAADAIDFLDGLRPESRHVEVPSPCSGTGDLVRTDRSGSGGRAARQVDSRRV